MALFSMRDGQVPVTKMRHGTPFSALSGVSFSTMSRFEWRENGTAPNAKIVFRLFRSRADSHAPERHTPLTPEKALTYTVVWGTEPSTTAT